MKLMMRVYQEEAPWRRGDVARLAGLLGHPRVPIATLQLQRPRMAKD